MPVPASPGRSGRSAAQATALYPPDTDQDYGSREFAARDPDGNLWSFGTYRPAGG